MHILLAALALVAIIAYWIFRTGQTTQSSGTALEAPQDVKAAANRFGYKAILNQHPTESVDDPRVTGAALLILVAEIDGGISRAEKESIEEQLRKVFELSESDSKELYVFAKWIASQSSNQDDMIRRLIMRTVKLGGRDTIPDMMQMVNAVGRADTGTLTDDTQQVIERLKQLLN